MLHFQTYVDQEIYGLKHTNPSPAEFHRQQWLHWREQTRIARGRAFLRWTGDRLVGAGERLRAWSGVDTRAADAAGDAFAGASSRRW